MIGPTDRRDRLVGVEVIWELDVVARPVGLAGVERGRRVVAELDERRRPRRRHVEEVEPHPRRPGRALPLVVDAALEVERLTELDLGRHVDVTDHEVGLRVGNSC